MTAESRQLDAGHGDAAAAVARPHVRLSVNAPPLAPALARANPPGLHLLIIVAVLVAAGVAELLGAPLFLTAALFLIGIGALLLLAFTLSAEGRLAAEVDEGATRSRAEFETLSDRMWELQESEERFRGLIDALGDLAVHRD